MRVKVVHGSKAPTADGATDESRLSSWERQTGLRAGTCAVSTCTGCPTVGARVRGVVSAALYVVPLCPTHHAGREVLDVGGPAVSAEPSRAAETSCEPALAEPKRAARG